MNPVEHLERNGKPVARSGACTTASGAPLLAAAESQRQSTWPSMEERVHKMWLIRTVVHFAVLKKKGNSDTC